MEALGACLVVAHRGDLEVTQDGLQHACMQAPVGIENRLLAIGGHPEGPTQGVGPGEGELTAAMRLLERLLPRLRKSLDLIVGDALYGCRPFFQTVCGAGLEGLALSSGGTEMDEEIDWLRKTDPPRLVPGVDVAVWEMESEAWRPDLK